MEIKQRNHFLIIRIIFIGWICLTPYIVLAELPTLGDPTIKYFSSQQEAALGKAFYTSLRENLNIINDLQIDYYLSDLANRLVSHSDAAGNHFKFFMVESNVINAFAGPHGYIGVNSGIMMEAKNESQFAGVLAHEISHVSQRHLARAFSQSGTNAAASFATLLAAILISTQDPAAGQAALMAGIAGAQQASINFTRHNEYEADRIGIDLLANAGINPEGMVGFFEILLSRGDGLNIEYLRTHPLNTNRVAEAKDRVKAKYSALPNDSIDYKFCKARLEVLTNNTIDSYINQADTDDDVLRYRHAIALIKDDQASKAIKPLESLSRTNTHPWIKLALAEALHKNNQIDEAKSTLKDLTQYYPDYLPVTLAYAKILIEHNQPQLSISLLLRQLQTNDSAIIHKTIAQAYYVNGQISAALESTGDQYELEGYTELAIQQYDNALQQPSLNPAAKKRLQTKKAALKPLEHE